MRDDKNIYKDIYLYKINISTVYINIRSLLYIQIYYNVSIAILYL